MCCQTHGCRDGVVSVYFQKKDAHFWYHLHFFRVNSNEFFDLGQMDSKTQDLSPALDVNENGTSTVGAPPGLIGLIGESS